MIKQVASSKHRKIEDREGAISREAELGIMEGCLNGSFPLDLKN